MLGSLISCLRSNANGSEDEKTHCEGAMVLQESCAVEVPTARLSFSVQQASFFFFFQSLHFYFEEKL